MTEPSRAVRGRAARGRAARGRAARGRTDQGWIVRGLHDRGRTEWGAGLIGTIAGVLVFLGFLLFAVQLLINLYATSTATSAAFDGARLVAGSRTDHESPESVARARAEAEHRMRDELGQLGDQVTFDWSASDGDVVAVRIQGPAPRFLLPGLGGPLGFDHIDRTARVRVEVPR